MATFLRACLREAAHPEALSTNLIMDLLEETLEDTALTTAVHLVLDGNTGTARVMIGRRISTPHVDFGQPSYESRGSGNGDYFYSPPLNPQGGGRHHNSKGGVAQVSACGHGGYENGRHGADGHLHCWQTTDILIS